MFPNDDAQAHLNNDTDFEAGPASQKWNPGSNFAWMAPKTLLRLAQMFCLFICLLCVFGLQDFTAYEVGNHTLLIILFCLFYVPASLVTDWANLYSFNPKLIHQLEFVFDFIFMNLLFFGACVLANWCNSRSSFDPSVDTCACLDWSNCDNKAALSAGRAIAAFMFFASFFFIPSTVFSYRFVASF